MTSSASWYDMSLFGWWSLGIGLLIVFGVPFLLIYYFTGQTSDAERTEVSTNDNDDDELPPQDLRDANDTLKGAFKAWCVSDRPLISMGSRFEWFVREEHGAEVPLSHWRALRHDRYVRASPSDATHWAFRSGDAAILFPKPEEDEFASLRGFAGTEVPGELNGIDPAYVSVHGDEAKLQAVGEIR